MQAAVIGMQQAMQRILATVATVTFGSIAQWCVALSGQDSVVAIVAGFMR